MQKRDLLLILQRDAQQARDFPRINKNDEHTLARKDRGTSGSCKFCSPARIFSCRTRKKKTLNTDSRYKSPTEQPRVLKMTNSNKTKTFENRWGFASESRRRNRVKTKRTRKETTTKKRTPYRAKRTDSILCVNSETRETRKTPLNKKTRLNDLGKH